MSKPIQVFLRHCYYSKLQELPDRNRPFWFDKNKVFQNFKKTIDLNLADYHIVYDEYYGSIENTFLREEKNVKIINAGSECDSFVETLNYAKSKNYSQDTIIYFLEDDYVHRPNWCKMLLDGFTLSPSYVTLYSCNLFENENIFYKIFTTKNSYWRVLPATTNTFACKYSTLLEDYEIHKEYSINGIKEEDGYHFTKDYDKFWKLGKNYDKYIISCLPGYSTHCDLKYISPFVDWYKILHEKTYSINY